MIINPNSLTEEQKNIIKAKYHEVRAINICTNDLFSDDIAIFEWFFGKEFFNKKGE